MLFIFNYSYMLRKLIRIVAIGLGVALITSILFFGFLLAHFVDQYLLSK
jgi:hypothetical protein